MLVFVIWFLKNLLILTETSKDSLNIKYILKGIWDSKTFIYLSWHMIQRNWIRIQLFKNKEMFMFFPNRNIWHFSLSTLDNFHIWSKYCLPRMLCWWGNKIPLLPCPVRQKKSRKSSDVKKLVCEDFILNFNLPSARQVLFSVGGRIDLLLH